MDIEEIIRIMSYFKKIYKKKNIESISDYKNVVENVIQNIQRIS